MYNCEVQVKHPHLAFRSANEIYMERMLERRIVGVGTKDLLSKWFYFYVLPIQDPLTVLHHEDGDVELHPGTNRFIGRSLRNDQPWAPAKIISINREWDKRLSGIRNESHEKTQTFDYNSKHDFYENEKLNAWSIGSYAPEPKTWLRISDEWAKYVLGSWGGRLVTYSGKTFAVNPHSEKKNTIVRHVKDFDGLFSATQFLFKELSMKLDSSKIDISKGI